MKFWSMTFFVFSILFAVISLITNDLQSLAVGLLFSIMGILAERKMK
jgi:hypothetical protein